MDTLIQLPKASWSHGSIRIVGKCWDLPPEALKVKKSPKTTVCTPCKYVDDERQHINESFDFTPDNEHNFYTSFLEKPLLDVATIEERIKAMNLRTDI